jgi:hypothetical protein
LQSNDAKLLSSIAKHPKAYGCTNFPATDIKQVGINLTQLQGLVAFRDLQLWFYQTRKTACPHCFQGCWLKKIYSLLKLKKIQ